MFLLFKATNTLELNLTIILIAFLIHFNTFYHFFSIFIYNWFQKSVVVSYKQLRKFEKMLKVI